ncbi:hypothetical protein Dsin_016986 [Dipteronia sinensis]|uniref:RNase H type-1 domain-containing protein n=1 Tax=Dipteronia sinensis TaxID=43782 RepID=A0AAE0AE47_9ROSI|nr:hypothetical protein Dsin_016986 [Dipteronia sinensis]
MLLNIKDLCVDYVVLKRSNIERWRPPTGDLLKFNVDGSAKGSPGLAGIGGVMRDSSGKVLCLFSISLGSQDSITADIMVMHKVVEIVLSNNFWNGPNMVIASDSKVAISWVNNDDFGSINHVNLIYDIRSWLKNLGNTMVVYNSRSANSFADILAKRGASNMGDFVNMVESLCVLVSQFVCSQFCFPLFPPARFVSGCRCRVFGC